MTESTSSSATTEVGFYHLTTTPLERALPKLLERVLATGRRALVVAGSPERVEALAETLWTYDPASFLPHGTAVDGHAALQPIWLSAEDENPNGAKVLVLVDGVALPGLDRFERCLDIFDGNDPAQVAAARLRYKTARDQGLVLRYFRQTESGWQAG